MEAISGRVVLVTGASRGLGVDIARTLGDRGARLALAARSRPELEQVRDNLRARGARVEAFPCDVSDRAALERLVADVEARLGPVEVLVNNAGVDAVGDFETTPLETIEQVYRVNVLAPTWLARLVVPGMIARGRGHVVNVASLAGLVGVPHDAVYCASKHAVVGLSRALRAELAEHGVRVSAVCPSFVDGGFFLSWGRPPPWSLGRVRPQEVADAVVEALQKDRDEVVLAGPIGRLGDVITAVGPDLATRVMKHMGMLSFLKEQARRTAPAAPPATRAAG